jgi:copper chaperone CopZ
VVAWQRGSAAVWRFRNRIGIAVVYIKEENRMATERFHVPEVSCQHCVNAVTQEVSALADVQNVQVSLDDKIVMVEHGDSVSTEAIVAAINEAGYDEVTKVG